jgi:hypothetical protein
LRRGRGARPAAALERVDDDHAAAATWAWLAVVGPGAGGHVRVVLTTMKNE